METRVLIPNNLKLVVFPVSKTEKLMKRTNSVGEQAEKPSSTGIERLDSESEEKLKSRKGSDFSSSDSSRSSRSSSRNRSKNLNLKKKHIIPTFTSNSDDSSDGVASSDSDSDSSSSSGSSAFEERRKSRKKSKSIRKTGNLRDDVRILAKARIPAGSHIDPNHGDVQIISLQGVESLSQDDSRQLFGCFDRVIPDPERNGMGPQIRLCNWIRFVRRVFSDSDSRINITGRFIEGKPVLEFSREIQPEEELVAYFDMGSLRSGIKNEPMNGLTKIDDDICDAPLDLSSRLKPTFPRSSIDPEESHRIFANSPEKLNPFSFRTISQPIGMKLFQPHLYSPPSSSLSTNATLSSPADSNPALHSPNSTTHHLTQFIGNRQLEFSKPILRTRGRERSLLPCEVCGKAFDRPSLLKRHMRTHTGEKPHICDVCNKGFSTSSSLNTHRRIHSGEKPHQCPQCGKRFTASSNLYYHKMTHNKEKPHKCLLCGKSFPTPGDLKSHQYVHSGSWPYNCPICHRGFSKQTNLRNHLLLHSGDKPHTCQTCGKKFALACNLRAHVRTHEEDPVTSCSSCKRTFLTSLNMLVNGQCRSCILHLQTSHDNNGTKNAGEIPVKLEPNPPETILPTSPPLLHGFQLPTTIHPPPGLLYETIGLHHGRQNPFLEQLFEWNWRFAKETAGNLGFMQQKLFESQMLAAQLMTVSKPPAISDILRFRTGLPHSAELEGSGGLNKF